MRNICIVIISGVLLAITSTHVLAAKPRIQKGTASAGLSGKGVSFTQARLSRPTNSIIFTLKNLGQVESGSYTLHYLANGIEQGVVGGINPAGKTADSRDLYFGTCSKGVCTPHSNIKNAVLTIELRLKSGVVYRKRYRIKV